jgi:hypothetical protein
MAGTAWALPASRGSSESAGERSERRTCLRARVVVERSGSCQSTLAVLSTNHKSPCHAAALSRSGMEIVEPIIVGNMTSIGRRNWARKKAAPRIPATTVKRRLDGSDR